MTAFAKHTFLNTALHIRLIEITFS